MIFHKKKLFTITIIIFLFHFFFLLKNSFNNNNKLNILLISIDTLRADYLGCYSGKLNETPNINKYCINGIQFLKAFAHNPVTLPSHINILTGSTPLFHNIHDNIGFYLTTPNITIAEYLKKYNYKTAAFIGAFPLDSRFGLDKGFDIYDDNYGEKSAPGIFYFAERPAGKVISSAMNWLKNNKNNKWFIFIHLFDPHQPYIPPPPFNINYKNNLYKGEIEYVDNSLATLFKYLKNNNLEKDTLLIITSDHGEGLGEHGENTHGYFAYNSTLHIPLIFYNPIIFPKPSKINTFVSHIDIFPTICEILNISIPNHVQGQSLIKIIYNKHYNTKPLYFESLSAYYNRNWAPLKGIIINNFKFIDSPIPELYDLSIDFKESNNIYNKIKHKYLKKELNNLIDNYSKKSLKQNRKQFDKESIEILRSLGYIGGDSNIQYKTAYTAADDLKTLLPLHQSLMDSLKLFEDGKIDAAIKKLKEIIKKRKDFTTAFAFLANLLHEIGDIQQAINILEEGIKYSPNNYELHSKLGIYYVEASENEKAIKEIYKAIKINNLDPEVWNYLGIAYWKIGSFDEAEIAYKKAIELDENYAGALNNLGSLYLSKKELTLAEQYFKKTLSYDPDLASAYNGLGIISQANGNKQEAIEYWKKALEKEPTHLLALYNIGYALATSDNKKEALPYLEKYLQIAPSNDSERQKVIWLIEAIEK